MPTQNEKELAKAIHALTECLSTSLELQAETYRILAKIHPAHSAGFEAAASGVQLSASNLVKHLPKLPVD